MADDDHYLEARPGYTAGGRLMATAPESACWSTYLAGYSAAFRCALPVGHDGSHESEGGTGWDHSLAAGSVLEGESNA